MHWLNVFFVTSIVASAGVLNFRTKISHQLPLFHSITTNSTLLRADMIHLYKKNSVHISLFTFPLPQKKVQFPAGSSTPLSYLISCTPLNLKYILSLVLKLFSLKLSNIESLYSMWKTEIQCSLSYIVYPWKFPLTRHPVKFLKKYALCWMVARPKPNY